MNLGLLFNTLGAAIHDGVPEDVKVTVADDNERGNEDVKAIWIYEPPHGDHEIIIASYEFKQMPNLRLLWQKDQ